MSPPWTVRPISEMPPPHPKATVMAGIFEAIRALRPGEALFFDCSDGLPLVKMQHSVSNAASKALANGHSRLDYEHNGVWIYRDGDAQSTDGDGE